MNLSLLPLLLWMMAAPQTAAPATTQTVSPPPLMAGHTVAFDINDCKTCHSDVFPKFEQTHHSTLTNSCSNCHGDVAAHAKSIQESGDAGPIVRLRSLEAVDANNICLQCHERQAQVHFRGSVHERRGVSCITCHSIHNFQSATHQLKTAKVSDTCYSCHAPVRAQMMKQSHHPVREGLIECTSCHNPHATTQRMLKADNVNELCYGCHADKRGPFLWEHAPVRENCTLCHTPHGSNHDSLLASKPPFLCQRCHLSTRHPGTLYDARNFLPGSSPSPATGTAISNRAVGRSCLNCHAAIHGSNAPSGPYLGR